MNQLKKNHFNRLLLGLLLAGVVVFAAYSIFNSVVGVEDTSEKVFEGEELTDEQVAALNARGDAFEQGDIDDNFRNTDRSLVESELIVALENEDNPEVIALFSTLFASCTATGDLACADGYIARAEGANVSQAVLAGYFAKQDIHTAAGDDDLAVQLQEIIQSYAAENELEELLQLRDL